MTERVTSRSGEVEWDIVLAAPPPGDGDLRVEATLEGLKRSPTRDGNLLRFTLTDGRVLRMGELVLMDASGRALRRALPQVDGSRLALQVPASVLDDARYPLTLDPTVSPEKAVAPDAGADQRRPSVAYDYVDFLVVWQDRRSGSWDIYGARVSKSGEVLDPAGFPISTASGDQTGPEVSAIDDRFLVVWTDRRSGVDVYLSRVLSGRVIDPAGIPVATGPAVQRSPTVAQNGDDVLVAWQENGIRGARFDAARGLVLDPGGFTISSLAHSYRPTSTPSASGTLVVWARFLSRRHGREIRAARVSTHGVVLDPSGILVSRPSGVTFPSPAVSGQFVVWDEGNRTDDNIRGARISDTGTVLDPGGIDVATGTADQDSPAVAFNGNALVAWHERRRGVANIRGARVANDGTVLDHSGFTIADATAPEQFPAVTGSEDQWGVVYQRSVTNAPNGTWHAYLRTVAPK
jgi:hypothetical protein